VNEIRDQSQTNNLTTFGPKYLFTTVNGYNQVIDTWYSHTKQRDYVQEIRIRTPIRLASTGWSADTIPTARYFPIRCSTAPI
jgi:hypothetical protein